VTAKYRILEEIDRVNGGRGNMGYSSKSDVIAADNVNIDNQKEQAQRKDYAFDDMALKFLEEKERSCKSGTLKNYGMFLKNLFPFFSKKYLFAINKAMIKEYENYRRINGCKEQYLREELSCLQNMFNLALEYEMTENNPFNSYKFRKQIKDYEPRERYLEPKEIQRLLVECNKYLQRLILFLLETGLRIKEALNICFSDISTDPKTNIQYLVLKKEITKSNKTRFVPLSKLAMEQINKQKIDFINSLFIFTDNKGNPYKTTPKKALRNSFRKANIEPAGFHIFRHTFASLKLQGLDVEGNKIRPLYV
jgi:integrase